MFILLIQTYSLKMVSTILLIRLVLVCTPTRMVDFYGKLLIAAKYTSTTDPTVDGSEILHHLGRIKACK